MSEYSPNPGPAASQCAGGAAADPCRADDSATSACVRLLTIPRGMWPPVALMMVSVCVLAIMSLVAMKQTAAVKNPNFISSQPTVAFSVAALSLVLGPVFFLGLARRWNVISEFSKIAIVLGIFHMVTAFNVWESRRPYDASALTFPLVIAGALWITVALLWSTGAAKKFLSLRCPSCGGPDVVKQAATGAQRKCRSCGALFSPGRLFDVGASSDELTSCKGPEDVASAWTPSDSGNDKENVMIEQKVSSRGDVPNLGEVMRAAQRSSRWVHGASALSVLACAVGLFAAMSHRTFVQEKTGLERDPTSLSQDFERVDLMRQYNSAVARGEHGKATRIFKKMNAIQGEIGGPVTIQRRISREKHAEGRVTLWGALLGLCVLVVGPIAEVLRQRSVSTAVSRQVDAQWGDVRSTRVEKGRLGATYRVFGRDLENGSQKTVVIGACTREEAKVVPELCEQLGRLFYGQPYYPVAASSSVKSDQE